MYNMEPFRPVRFHGAGALELRGQHVEYETWSEDNVFYDESGSPIATIFTYSYFRTNTEDKASRPVLFIFNGGPGASSMLVHSGCFGAKRVNYPESTEDYPTLPPFEVKDNPDCLLDIADLVLVDPISTGYGLLLDESQASRFYGIDEDAEALVNFIENWCSRYHRWNSPKYLVGESYGCTRAATAAGIGITGGPERSHHLTFDGLIFIGNTVTQAKYFNKGIPVEPAVEALPTMAAINWYHKHPVDQPLEEFVLEAKKFAADEYISALFKSDELSEEERTAVKKKIMYYTGVSDAYLEANDLKVERFTFCRELLKKEGKIISILDGRFTIDAYKTAALNSKPGMLGDGASIHNAALFEGALRGEIFGDLGITDFNRCFAGSVNLGTELTRPRDSKWDFDTDHLISGERLQAAMNLNPHMRVLFENGWYDLCTQTGLIWHDMAHLHLPEDRVFFKGLKAGHMAYLGEENCKELCDAIHSFLQHEDIQ